MWKSFTWITDVVYNEISETDKDALKKKQKLGYKSNFKLLEWTFINEN